MDENLTVISLHSEQAEDALTKLTRNVPFDVEIGRPAAAAYDPVECATMFVTDADDGTLWWSYPAHAERMVQIGDDDLFEVTKWYGGVEYERFAGTAGGRSST